MTNRERTIPAGHAQLERVGTLQNFELAAKSARAGYRALGIMFDRPFPFLDSDVYKWLEGAGWEVGREPDPRIRAMADEAIALVEAAQRPDGYLNTFVQVLDPGTEYRDLAWGHELYCIGHLIQAAIAWHRGVGDDRLLRVAERAIDSVAAALGPGRREAIDGHPEIEMALVEFFRVTGDRRHLDSRLPSSSGGAMARSGLAGLVVRTGRTTCRSARPPRRPATQCGSCISTPARLTSPSSSATRACSMPSIGAGRT